MKKRLIPRTVIYLICLFSLLMRVKSDLRRILYLNNEDQVEGTDVREEVAREQTRIAEEGLAGRVS